MVATYYMCKILYKKAQIKCSVSFRLIWCGEGKVGFEQRHEHSQKLSLPLYNHLNANEMIYCCVDANGKLFFFPVFSRQQICHSLKKIFNWNREENREFIEDSSTFKKIGNKDGKMVFFTTIWLEVCQAHWEWSNIHYAIKNLVCTRTLWYDYKSSFACIGL